MSSTLNGLNRRVEHLESSLPSVASLPPIWENIDKQAQALLADGEYVRFTAFIARVKPQISIDNGRLNLRQLSNQDLDTLDVWMTLIEEREQAQWSKG